MTTREEIKRERDGQVPPTREKGEHFHKSTMEVGNAASWNAFPFSCIGEQWLSLVGQLGRQCSRGHPSYLVAVVVVVSSRVIDSMYCAKWS